MSPRLAEIEDQAMKLKLMNYSAGRIGNESLGHHDRLKAEELNITIQVPDSRTLVGSAIINRLKLEPKAKRMLSDLNSANPALREALQNIPEIDLDKLEAVLIAHPELPVAGEPSLIPPYLRSQGLSTVNAILQFGNDRVARRKANDRWKNVVRNNHSTLYYFTELDGSIGETVIKSLIQTPQATIYDLLRKIEESMRVDNPKSKQRTFYAKVNTKAPTEGL